jgi:hypothetical protein
LSAGHGKQRRVIADAQMYIRARSRTPLANKIDDVEFSRCIHWSTPSCGAGAAFCIME